MYKYNTWQFLKLDEAQGYGKCISNYYFCQKRNKDTNTKANTHIVIKATKNVLHESQKLQPRSLSDCKSLTLDVMIQVL